MLDEDPSKPLFDVYATEAHHWDKTQRAAFLLHTYRDEDRISPMVGTKLVDVVPCGIKSSKSKISEELIYTRVIVGCFSPGDIHGNWTLDEEAIMTNHPKCGSILPSKWPHVVQVPESSVGVYNRTITLPPSFKAITKVSHQMLRYGDLPGFVELNKKLSDLSTVMSDILRHAAKISGNEAGWYLTMSLDPEEDDEDRFEAFCLPDILYMVSQTIMRENQTGNRDSICSLDLHAFRMLHEEVALASFAAKNLGQEYGSLYYLLSNKGKYELSLFEGILAEDVISTFGSFESAMLHVFLHCSSFEADAEDLLSKTLKEYPDYIIWSMAELPDWLKK